MFPSCISSVLNKDHMLNGNLFERLVTSESANLFFFKGT